MSVVNNRVIHEGSKGKEYGLAFRVGKFGIQSHSSQYTSSQALVHNYVANL